MFEDTIRCWCYAKAKVAFTAVTYLLVFCFERGRKGGGKEGGSC